MLARGRRHALVARNCRRDRFSRRRPDARGRHRFDRRPAARAGRTAGRCAAVDGRRRAQADLPQGASSNRLRQERLTGSSRRATTRPPSTRWRSTACCTVASTGTARRRSAPRSTIKAFTTDDLRAFYASAFQPANAALLVVGDVTWTRCCRCSNRASADGKRPGRPGRRPRSLTLRQLADADHLCRRQARSAAVADSHRLDRRARSTPDYFPIQVMNTILGGSFSSRLNLNLREKNGYTYGASSGFDMRVVGRTVSSRQPACRPTRPPKR